MTHDAVAVPPGGSIPQEKKKEELYFRILVDARRARVYGSHTEDVAHEAWIIAVGRGYYCRRMLSEAARNLGLWRAARESELAEAMEAGIPVPYEAAVVAEVTAAVATLHPLHRAIVYMYHCEGRTFEEIAGLAGENPSTVRTHLKEAEAALRNMLADYAPRKRRKSEPEADLPLFRGEVV